MGTISCSAGTVEFEDRLLTHLQIVAITRFRRHEPLLMSWINDSRIGSGRSSLWLSPTDSVQFRFNGSRVPAIDRDWLALLEASAESPTGLIVTDQHGTPVRIGSSGTALPPMSRIRRTMT